MKARRPLGRRELRRLALRVLDGVGDARLGQWEEQHGAYHVRRRLTDREALLVGPVEDVRGTDEAKRRAALIPAQMLAHAPAEVLAEEVG